MDTATTCSQDTTVICKRLQIFDKGSLRKIKEKMSTYGTVASGSDDKQPLFAAPSDAPAQEPIYQERTQTRTMVNEHTLWIVEEEGRKEQGITVCLFVLAEVGLYPEWRKETKMHICHIWYNLHRARQIGSVCNPDQN